MKNFYTKACVLLFLVTTSALSFAQTTITGSVKDASTGEALISASIVVKGTTNGTSTDTNGSFSLQVSTIPVTLTVSFIGYQSQDVTSSGGAVNVLLAPGQQLEDAVIVGSRFIPRTAISSPVPIDNISASELESTGQHGVDKMLTFKVPSYNSTQQTVSDATAHFDPADLRNLGPSRTLVLINGKRKNASSLVYINDTPGKGEVGVDMNSIPSAAIARVEVLRDGASAQYGSDAIAGVINIILKEDVEYTSVNFTSGITTEGDGATMGYDVNTGAKIGDNGYVNITASYYDQKETNRAGQPGSDALFIDLIGLEDNTGFIDANPDLGMHVGTPNMTTNDLFYNASIDLDDNTELYSFGGVTQRQGLSYALYRAPYWIGDPNNIFGEGADYDGFQPTFETDILDNTFAVGVRGMKGEWNYDLSSTSGGNSVNYTIGNTINTSMGAASPTSFQAGGYEFSHSVTNLDLGRQYGKLSVGLGTEFRFENFIANAGEEASYIDGGAQSFPGIQPQNEVNATRHNAGVYADLGYDVTEDFYIGGAARMENYSDFGENFSWKVSSRYQLMDDKMTVRGSASTGFRAPSLHQIYMSNVQTLVSGGTISNQGTFANGSAVVRSLGVAPLTNESADNISFGIAMKPMEGLYVSLDYYQVNVQDRIVYSSSIASSDTTSAVYAILQDNDVTSLKFFTNAVDTETKGLDIVVSYTGMEIGSGRLGINFSANFNETRVVGEVVTPTAIADSGVDLFDRKEQSRLETARPSDKQLIGLTYRVGKLTVALNNTRFGEVTWKHQNNDLNGAPFGPNGEALPLNDADYDQTFSAKVLTDLNLNYQITEKVGFNLAINNLLNVYPDVIDTKGDMVTDLGGRFLYPWEVNQFGFNGTTIAGKLSFQF
ncbi:MAG: TonB-dependent receptor [Bacteroidetes bacterium]|nr:MAG: TonB-dependent receptor [Bacteroidota bacterium]